MNDKEYLRKLVAELDSKAGEVLTLLDVVDDDDDGEAEMLQDHCENLQAGITDWQQAKGYI